MTGEPIYRALVQVGGEFATLTDHEGHFEFNDVTSPAIPAWAMKPGYFAENRFQRSSPGAQSNNDPVVVKLVPEAVISGTVTGQDGSPLEGIHVQLKTLTVSNGLNRWVQRQGTTTNSEGRFRFYELPAGKYALSTGFHLDGLPDSQTAVAYVPAQYPEAGGATEASAIVVAPGDHREATLSPNVEKLYPVTGTVSGYGESRNVSFHIETASGEEITPIVRFFAHTGEFRLMLPGGAYMVTATAYQQGMRGRGQLESTRAITVPEGPVSGVGFTLEPAANIPVDIELTTVNQPAEGSVQQPPSPNIALVNVDPHSPYSMLFAAPLHHGDSYEVPGGPGPRQFESVPPGRYTLFSTPDGGWYVASAYCGSVDLTREELVVTGGAAGCSIRIVLRNDSGSVHVSVRDPRADNGQPQSGAAVYLLPLGDFIRQEVQIPSNALSADSTMTGVAPGRYLAVALDHPQELAYHDLEALRRYAPLGQEVTVTPNGKADVEVNLVNGEP
ncbi:hypothetical protein ACPOL_0461 [Acidisarcina polymorpha]|uniref:Carboxypeptidase regulatory-like domain-containing protein n=1 Tax=Acidisarcina polymorpha TaxID=2211140 RepID=A0A2Z5FSM4_9BACT|nr:hypothetical protein ACPOL_0461 [Acidisarcina polymorpha]